jgi:hypothetical protein
MLSSDIRRHGGVWVAIPVVLRHGHIAVGLMLNRPTGLVVEGLSSVVRFSRIQRPLLDVA